MLCVYLVSGCIACLLCVNVVYAVCVGGRISIQPDAGGLEGSSFGTHNQNKAEMNIINSINGQHD